MTKLTILVPSDSTIEMYLSRFPHSYRVVNKTYASVEFSYSGVIPPLAKISELLAQFQPEQYHISKSTTGFSFIVCP